MSYARFGGDSDVYVFFSVGDFLDCCGCQLQQREWVDSPGEPFGGYCKVIGPIVQTTFTATQDMVDHLALHTAAGHHVPEYLVPALWEDDAENFGGAS